MAEGEIEAPSKEAVQATVVTQVALASNLCLGLKGIQVNAEPAQLVQPAISFQAPARKGR
jgi:hypothetical protein